MLTLAEIQQQVEDAATLIGAPTNGLPTYGRSDDFGRPYVEVMGRTYYYRAGERGHQIRKWVTQCSRELFYWIFRDVRGSMAGHWESQHRIPHQDSRRLVFRKQLELLGQIDPSYAEQRAREIEEILTRYPYDDER